MSSEDRVNYLVLLKIRLKQIIVHKEVTFLSLCPDKMNKLYQIYLFLLSSI